MADLRWMKFWPRDYMGDTGHLTLAEHGAYLKLLCLAWDNSACSLPADRAWLKRKLGVTERQFKSSVDPVIAEFWTEEDHRIFQNRQRKEKEAAEITATRRKEAAEARWRGKKVIPLKRKEIE